MGTTPRAMTEADASGSAIWAAKYRRAAPIRYVVSEIERDASIPRHVGRRDPCAAEDP